MKTRQKTEKETFTYDVIRKLIHSDCVAMELWRVIDATNMKSENVECLIGQIRNLSFNEKRQTMLLDAVWDRHYQMIAEQLLPKEVAK